MIGGRIVSGLFRSCWKAPDRLARHQADVLAILTSHPIQYQAPLWRTLTSAGVPLKVWHLTPHGVADSADPGFGRSFAWDIDLLGGYPHEFLDIEAGWDIGRFRGVRLRESLAARMRREGVRAMWVEGWRFQVFWQAVRDAARREGSRLDARRKQ